MADTTDKFYNLIEIAKKLSDAISDFEKMPSKATRRRKTLWQNKMGEWLKENYEYDGTIKNEQYRQLMESSF